MRMPRVRRAREPIGEAHVLPEIEEITPMRNLSIACGLALLALAGCSGTSEHRTAEANDRPSQHVVPDGRPGDRAAVYGSSGSDGSMGAGNDASGNDWRGQARRYAPPGFDPRYESTWHIAP